MLNCILSSFTILSTKQRNFQFGKEALMAFFALSLIILTSQENTTLAYEYSDIPELKIITDGDLYVESKIPTRVSFDVIALDSSNNEIPVQCDRISDSIFEVGKTTVRCMVEDTQGKIMTNSFVVTVGYKIVQFPDWFKQTTEMWTSQYISDTEYVDTLSFLLREQIIHVPTTKSSIDNPNSEMPIWLSNNAEKWTRGEISDDEFSIVILWMINNGMIKN